jgi:hypothetical protein
LRRCFGAKQTDDKYCKLDGEDEHSDNELSIGFFQLVNILTREPSKVRERFSAGVPRIL